MVSKFPAQTLRWSASCLLSLLLLVFWAGCIGAFANNAHANVITVTQGNLYANDERIALDADFDLRFSSQLQEALQRGVPLYFLLEVQITAPRWYWLDAKPVDFQRTTKVTYTPLLNQYRVTASLLTTSYASFGEMVRAISRVRGVQVGDKGALKVGQQYHAFVRYRLDSSQLPKPFQLSALTSDTWKLASEWTRVEIRP